MVANKRPKGDGSVYQRKDGRWVAELPLPDLDGKRRSKTAYAKTEAQAKVKLTEMRRAKIKNDGDLPTGSMRVSALMDRWYMEVAEKTHKPKTAANERSVIRNHIVPAIGKVGLDKLSRLHFERLTAAIEAKGLGSATMILAHSTLSSAVGYAFKSDLITSDISAKATRPVASTPQLAVLTAEDGKKLLQMTAGDRLGSRIAAALLTGARQGELLGLELERLGSTIVLDWQLQRVTKQHGCGTSKAEEYTNRAGKPAVRFHWPCGNSQGARCPDGRFVFPRNAEHRQLEGGLFLVRPKSKKGYRVLPVGTTMRAVIERRLHDLPGEPNPHGLLWTSDPKKDRHGRPQPLDGSPLDPRVDNEYWHRALVRAGLETESDASGKLSIDKMVRLHDARHTGASLFLGANVPEKTIMELMGHSSYAVTRRYQHVSQELGLAAMDGMALQLGYVPNEVLEIEPPE
jgi:integrase